MAGARKTIRFGIIGLGLMGREFASAAARWCHLLDLDFAPRLTGICDTNTALFGWYESHFDTIRVRSTDYRDLLDSADIDAIYCAVPHNLHRQCYVDIINAGKHLLGEKPFGIDLAANTAILEALRQRPDVLVACSSEFPFYPAAQRVIQYIQDDPFGQIIEVWAGFLHSSDLDPNKKINWKRMIDINGEYGAMGDLGMHVLHIPLRFGWLPRNVRAMLSNIVQQRPDASGALVPCETWDNATLCGEVQAGERQFPLYLQTYRIAPGEMNTWYIRIIGTRFSVEYSTKHPKTLRTMIYAPGGDQVWSVADVGYTSAYPAITGGIFEFGFPDAILQMWAAFCDELTNGRSGMRQPFYCATPEETHQHHRVLTAALESQRQGQVVAIS